MSAKGQRVDRSDPERGPCGTEMGGSGVGSGRTAEANRWHRDLRADSQGATDRRSFADVVRRIRRPPQYGTRYRGNRLGVTRHSQRRRSHRDGHTTRRGRTRCGRKPRAVSCGSPSRCEPDRAAIGQTADITRCRSHAPRHAPAPEQWPLGYCAHRLRCPPPTGSPSSRSTFGRCWRSTDPRWWPSSGCCSR